MKNSFFKQALVGLFAGLILISSSLIVIGYRSLPDCCPSGIDDKVLMDRVMAFEPTLDEFLENNPELSSADYDEMIQKDFDYYKKSFSDKIIYCEDDRERIVNEYKDDLAFYKDRNLGFHTSMIISRDPDEMARNLADEVSEREESIHHKVSVTTGKNDEKSFIESLTFLKEFMDSLEDKDATEKYDDYAIVSAEVFEKCYDDSVIKNCFFPCMDRISRKNEEIRVKREQLLAEEKYDEAYALEEYSQNDCEDECGMDHYQMGKYEQIVNDCSDEGVAEYKELLPYISARNKLFSTCNSVYDLGDDWKGIFLSPVGFVSGTNSDDKLGGDDDNKEGSVNDGEVAVDKIVVKSWGKELTEGSNYHLPITITFLGHDKEGEEVGAIANSIPELVFDYELPKGAILELDYKIGSFGLGESSSLDGEVWIKKGDLKGVKEPIKVRVFASGYEADSAEFSVVPRERLRILSLRKLSEKSAWDGSWATFEVVIDDPQNTYVKYTITSTSDNSHFFLKNLERGNLLTYTSKDDSLRFGWSAPKISEAARIDYAKHLKSLLLNAGTKLAGDKLLSKYESLGVGKGGMGVPDPESVNKWFDNSMNLVGGVGLGSQLGELANGPSKGESGSFFIAKNLVNGFANMEGFFGSYTSATPYGAGMKVLSYGLLPLQEWYSVVDEMINISEAKKINKKDRIIVVVENNLGDKDVAELEVNTEGFEKLLDND